MNCSIRKTEVSDINFLLNFDIVQFTRPKFDPNPKFSQHYFGSHNNYE